MEGGIFNNEIWRSSWGRAGQGREQGTRREEMGTFNAWPAIHDLRASFSPAARAGADPGT